MAWGSRKEKNWPCGQCHIFRRSIVCPHEEGSPTTQSLGFCPTKILQKAFTWGRVDATLGQLQSEARYLDRNDVSMSFPPY